MRKWSALLMGLVALAVIHGLLGVSPYYRKSIFVGTWATTLGVLIVTSCIIFLCLFIAASSRQKSEGRPKSSFIADVASLETSDRLIVTDSASPATAVEVRLVRAGRCAVHLTTYQLSEVREIARLIIRLENTQHDYTERIGEIVINSGVITISALQSASMISLLIQTSWVSPVFDARASSSIRLKASADRVVSVELTPPYGNGSYPLFALKNSQGTVGLECILINDAE